jgi:hypothetical protein
MNDPKLTQEKKKNGILHDLITFNWRPEPCANLKARAADSVVGLHGDSTSDWWASAMNIDFERNYRFLSPPSED